ncbi:MAG TPA: GntR family transcriptional regulator [Planctomycetota bacterium]|jgi:DNA-binding LacI/PurR family transcriptional regulator|nr:GntR family transcriptional regulator [Planctomycetota bacterium]
MAKPRRSAPLGRLARPQSLLHRTEQVLREAIARGEFGGNRLPPAAELAEQLGVSRETVRLAQENLQREGLLVKYRRRGTLIQPPALTLRKSAPRSTLLGYLQTDYPSKSPEGEDVTRATSGLMLQGALKEAGRAGYQLVVRHAPADEMDAAIDRVLREAPLRGVIFCSFGEDKMVRRVLGAGLPVVMLDHELNLPRVSTVREDSRQGVILAIHHLARLGHRRIAYAHWNWADVNPWRVAGYRKGLSEERLPRRRAWELSTEITPAGADALVERFLKLQPRPTALVCFSNTLAALAIERFRRHGVRVPEDLSVFGIGGEEISGMTCVQADWFGMGREAVRTLLRAAGSKEDAAPEHRLFPYQLRPGRSSAPPTE